MKLIIAVVQDKDALRLVEALVDEGFQATKLATTGGFLKAGNTTMLVVVPPQQVEPVLNIIKRICHSRDELVTPVTPVGGPADSFVPYPVEVTVGGATVFVLSIEKFVKV